MSNEKRKVLGYLILGGLLMLILLISVIEIKKKYFYSKSIGDKAPQVDESVEYKN